MRKLNLRQGAMAGFVLSIVLSGTAAARSDTPLLTFLGIAVVCLVSVGLAMALVIAINRSDDPWQPRR